MGMELIGRCGDDETDPSLGPHCAPEDPLRSEDGPVRKAQISSYNQAISHSVL